VTQINHTADTADDVVRISMDAKATVKVGPCARGGKARVQGQAADHDWQPLATVTPGGIFLPTLEELLVYGVTSKVTSDCLVDRLAQWWEAVRERFAHMTTLVINLDTGPEHQSRRPQCMQRSVDVVQPYHVTVRLASDPPYHSKYHPIERGWGIVENHGNGTLLDAVDTVLQFARTMPGQGKPPIVALVTTSYQTGVRLTQEAMETVEERIKRLPALGTWLVDMCSPVVVMRDT
jgi:DDE family transposase